MVQKVKETVNMYNSHPSVWAISSRKQTISRVEISRLEEQEMFNCLEPGEKFAWHEKVSGASVGPGVTGAGSGNTRDEF